MDTNYEKFKISCRVIEALSNYNFSIDNSNKVSNESSDIITRKVIAYAVVQFNYSMIQPDDSAKYIKTMPIFENLQDKNSLIECDINLPLCANIINILPVTNQAVGVFGAVPYERTRINDISDNLVTCLKYDLLGIETGDILSNDKIWKDKLSDIWINAITESEFEAEQKV